MVGWAPPGGLPLPSPPPNSQKPSGDGGEVPRSLMDGKALSVTELPQLKPLKVILLLILCGRSHSFLRETSDFHLRDAWLRLSHPKR